MSLHNAAAPRPGDVLALVSDIEDGGAIARDFHAGAHLYSMILARRDARVFAYENRCPHAGQRLERLDGAVRVQEGGYILCAAHLASFELETGACAGGPCNGRALTPIAVRVDGGKILMGAGAVR